MQELFTALQMLQKGGQSLATSRAIRDANEQVQQVLATETDEAKQLASLRQLAGGLTRQLAGIGSDAATIEQVSKSIAPPQPNIQTAEQAYLVGDPKQRARSQDIFAMDFAKEKIKAGAKTNGIADQKVLLAQMDRFNSHAKPQLKSLEAIDSLHGLLSGGSNVDIQMARRKLLEISGEDKYTDADLEGVTGSADAASSILRFIKKGTLGTTLDADIAMFKKTAQTMEAVQRKRLNEKATGFARSRGKVLQIDPDTFKSYLLEQASGVAPSPFSSKPEAAPSGAVPDSSGHVPNPNYGSPGLLKNFFTPKRG